MKKELDEKLQARFLWLKRSELERDREYEYVPGYTIYENWGFSEVSDGWYELIYKLCEEIETAYGNENRPIDMILQQVKSKFGHLCWYYSIPGHEQGVHAIDSVRGQGIRLYPKRDENSFENQIAEIVSRYEKLSRIFCESCGSDKAELRTERPYFRWVSTLCEECKNKRIRSYHERVIEKDELID